MAAATITRNANTIHATGGADATTAITAKPVILVGVVLTGNGAAAGAALADIGSGTPAKAHFRAADATTQFWDLSNAPILFPNGISVDLLTATDVLTLIVMEGRK